MQFSSKSGFQNIEMLLFHTKVAIRIFGFIA